jgi:hypothetical protein
MRNIIGGTKATSVFRPWKTVPNAHLYNSRAAGVSPPSTGSSKKKFYDKCSRRLQSIIVIATITIIVCLIDQG